VETNDPALCEMCGDVDHQVNTCPHQDTTGTSKAVPDDQEGRMAKAQLYKIVNHAQELYDNLHDDDELESWIQSKIATMSHMIGSVKQHLEYESKDFMEDQE
tara:strand:+ start:605 stop:910 length:306 start_codon:yes stop_codon:yes gene_type:complete